jgi:hypothetical protein
MSESTERISRARASSIKSFIYRNVTTLIQVNIAMATSSLTSRKRALRKSLSSVLRALSQDDVRAQCNYRVASPADPQRYTMTTLFLLLASAILARVLSAPWFDKATTVSCYLSMPAGEVDTTALTSSILQSGTRQPANCRTLMRLTDPLVFHRMIRNLTPLPRQGRLCSFPGSTPPSRGGWTSSGFTTRRTCARSRAACGVSRNRRLSTAMRQG